MVKEPWKFRLSDLSPWDINWLISLYPELYSCADKEEKRKMDEKLSELDKRQV